MATIVRYVDEGPVTFTENDWNEHSVKKLQEQGKNTPGFDVYRASKTLAERGAFFRIHGIICLRTNTCPCSCMGVC